MVEMKVTNDDGIDELCIIFSTRDVLEVWESSLIIISHMHAAVEHNISSSNGYNNAGATNILPGTCNQNEGEIRFLIKN